MIRMSPPYKWLLISTTLFQQSVSAYRQGVLQLKTLKDGFECNSCANLTNLRFYATIFGTLSPWRNTLFNDSIENYSSRSDNTIPRDSVFIISISISKSTRRR